MKRDRLDSDTKLFTKRNRSVTLGLPGVPVLRLCLVNPRKEVGAMSVNRDTMEFDPRRIQHGWDVYGSDGDKVGDVSEVHDSYLVLSKGFFFPKEYYIPFSAITRVERERVYLSVSKDQVEHQGWDEAPRGGMAETRTGYRAESERPLGAMRADHERTEEGRTVQLREEELRASKQSVEAGEVEIRKDVVSEQRTIDVPVTREEVVVERHPVDRRESDRPIGEGETIRVPVREEQVSVEKRPVVTEEIEIGKRQVTETQRVSDTVRREEAVIDREGDVDVGGDWSRASNDFRSDWQSRHGTSGRTWEQDEPGYRYGWESARDQRYQGRQWADVESDLSRDWGSRYGRHGKWDEVKERAREAWERGRR